MAKILHPVPAERALQQLDVYKTPLLPTRMRTGSDSITAKVIPDMFRSRRSSRLVLMSDDRSGAKKNKGPVVNETKPYAGEGGMKKLLARAKLEAEKEKEKEKENENENGGRTGSAIGEEPASLEPSLPSSALPPPPASDWFKSAVAGAPASSGSSLRVGRQKTSRNHIQRPSKSRFSAVYEDEGDDTMEDDDKAKERQALEEAAKKVPVFNIPAGFSFAKEVSAYVLFFIHSQFFLLLTPQYFSILDGCTCPECCRSRQGEGTSDQVSSFFLQAFPCKHT